MVIIFGSGWGPRRRRRRSHGYGYGQRYGHRRHPGYGLGRRDDSCLRDLLFLNTGCCLANAIGCGADSLYLAPTTLRRAAREGAGGSGRLADRMIAVVRVYQREISPKLPPGVCRFEPSCSHYAVEALERHGAGRGSWLTARRLLRCNPWAARVSDRVPATD